ncbi:MAG: TonB-dependent receptor [Pedobacter sp.]|nr:MAG: TonB-dependent receptor [Pedobacter sp.]
MNSGKSELNNFQSAYSITQNNSTYRNSSPNATDIYSVQTDITKNLKSTWELRTGLKFVATERDNVLLNENFISGSWVYNPILSNQFLYNEYLSMAYASASRAFGKTSFKLGLRAEHTRMIGNSVTSGQTFKRNYLALFPSLFITRKMGDKEENAVYFSYSRRIQRPAFSILNPYRVQFDDYLAQLGNPDLLPEYTHKLELGSVLYKGITVDTYLAITTDRIGQLANPTNKAIEYQPRNFSSSTDYGMNIYAPVKITSSWNTSSSFSLFNSSYRLEDFQIRQTTFNFRTQHYFSFKDIIDLETALDYGSPYVAANTRYAYRLYTDLGVSKRFLDKKLQLRLYAGDLFNTSREKDVTEYSGTRIDFYQKRPTRVYSLSLTYNFSAGKKFSTKQIEQSNEEERRRIGN